MSKWELVMKIAQEIWRGNLEALVKHVINSEYVEDLWDGSELKIKNYN